MKRILVHAISLAALLTFLGCSGNKLTRERVQDALNGWVKGGTVTVIGVQEFPSENRASATLEFTNLKTAPYHRTGMLEPSTLYSGPAEATLVHYNDGRWVITKLHTLPNRQMLPQWDSLNVEVK